MRKLVLWLTIGASLALAARSIAAEQSAAPTAARVTVRREANYLCVDNRPTLLLWAQGVTDPEELADYQEVGLNTLYVRVTDASDDSLQGISDLLSAAEAKGLLVVVALAPQALSNAQGERLPIDAGNAAYVDAVAGFVGATAGKLSAHPRIIAWLVEAVPSYEVAWGDDGFRSFLQDAYPSLDRLNASWGSEIETWDNVTTGAAREVDSTFPGGVARAGVDFTAYREQTYAKAVSLWANAIRAADPGRPVLASAMSDYRSIASVTPDFDGFALNVYPSVAEGDWETHNVQAVDIARRANQFAAIQTLDVNAGNPGQVAGWAQLALLHGAAGVAFTDWPQIRRSDGLWQVVKDLAGEFANDTGFPQTPLARVAILYSPIAGGATRNGVGLYGYLDGLTPNEPTNLFAMLRTGSRYGEFDVLTLSSIDEVNLGDYGAVIAPMAFYLPEAVQIALQNFVLRGGALVLDAGAGMYQADGNLYSMPPVLREMLGLRYTDLSAPSPGDQSASAGEPGSPGTAGSPGDAGLTPVGPVERGLGVSDELRKLMEVMEHLLGRSDVTKYLGEAFAVGAGPPVRVREMGRGFAVYLPMFLYQEWNTGDPMFADFHREILSHRADVEMVSPDALWSSDVSIAVYTGWPIGVSTVGREPVAVDAFEAESQMYLIPGGAMRVPNPDEDRRTELLFPPTALALVHPVPIYLRPLAEGGTVTASLVHYGSDGIELALHGPGAQVASTANGLQISGGEATPVEIEIRDGVYPVASGSIHHLTVADGPRRRTIGDQEIMPNADTGSIVLTTSASWTYITLKPVPE